MDRVSLIQIDSVNVLARSHYLPFFSRLGPYPMELLDDLAYRRVELFEYWAHVASLIPVRHFPMFRHRMAGAEPPQWIRRVMEEHPGYVEAVLGEVARRGPLTVSELEDPGARTGPWWGYGKGKVALEWHFMAGNVTVRDRRNFARVYDLTERVIPSRILEAPALDREEAHREMLRLAARAHGVGTASDLADYYRLLIPHARERLRELVESGDLLPVRVEGWRQPAYMHCDARLPRRIRARALVSPFDSLVWERDRTERLFGFRYRIEIYTPEPQRQYGYYVLPFLLGDTLVARVDLKADRSVGVLRVRAAHLEAEQDAGEVAAALSEELCSMAQWLRLDGMAVEDRGDLACPLRAALPARQ